MLEKFRNGINSTWAKIILGLIIISFVFAGIGSYLVSNVNNEVAIVNGDKISRMEFDRRYRQEKTRLGEKFTKFYNTESTQKQFAETVVERLIMEKLVEQASNDLGLYVSKQAVMDEISKTTAFQINGKFSAGTFRNLLNSNNLTPDQYEGLIRKQKQTAQLAGLMGSEFSLPAEVNHLLSLQGQTRSGGYVAINAELLKASIGFEGLAGEKKLKDYYQNNLGNFQIPEMVIAEYVELDANKIKVDVSEAQLKTYYNEHPDDFGNAEQRRASHILISTAADADETTIKKAQLKADKLLVRIKAGEDFAVLAKTQSDDTGSAEKNGDLGYFEKNVMTPEFDAAVFSLQKVGDVTGVVKSSFGFHIIKLTDIKAGTIKPFAEVKDQVKKALEASLRDEKFVELNDILTEKAFEVVDSLEEVALSTELDIRVSAPFSNRGGKGIFSNRGIIEAAFSDNVLINGYNSEVISLAEDHTVVLRIKKQLPARIKTFDEVRLLVEKLLRGEEAETAAEKLSELVFKTLKAGDSIEKALALLPEQMKAKWHRFDNLSRNDAKIPRELTRFIFQMAKPASEKAVFAKTTSRVGFDVVKLTKVTAGDASKSTAAQKKQVAEFITKKKASAEDHAFQNWLKNNADIERLPISN